MSAGTFDGALRRLFSQLSHGGDPDPHAEGMLRCGQAGREALGTRVRFCLRWQDGRVRQARYRAYGCPYTLATCEWLAGRLEGLALPERSPDALAGALGAPPDWADALGIPPERLGRLLIIEDALHAALRADADADADPAMTNPA